MSGTGTGQSEHAMCVGEERLFLAGVEATGLECGGIWLRELARLVCLESSRMRSWLAGTRRAGGTKLAKHRRDVLVKVCLNVAASLCESFQDGKLPRPLGFM